MCCEILKGCPSFRPWKKSCNSTLKFVNFKYSIGLGYCIKGVAGRKATGWKKNRCGLGPIEVATWFGLDVRLRPGSGVATWLGCSRSQDGRPGILASEN